MTSQGGVTGSVLGIRDDLTSLVLGVRLESLPLAILDVLLVATILYAGYRLIRDTRAIRILYGLVLLGLVYAGAELLGLTGLLFLLRSAFAALLVAIPVVFQPELRAGLERLGRARLTSRAGSNDRATHLDSVRILAQTAAILAAKKTGALVVLELHDSLDEYAATGVPLDAQLSAELLLTIFRTGSPLHDGAVVVRGLTILAASGLLPIAGDRFDSSIGTRHRAAIGVTQETDAIALIVSEETGRISVAHEGQLRRNVRPSQLETALAELVLAAEPGSVQGNRSTVRKR
jgi:diadenylate cyclase